MPEATKEKDPERAKQGRALSLIPIGTVFSDCARALELLPDTDQRMRVLKALMIIFDDDKAHVR